MTAPVVMFSDQAPNLLARYADTDAWQVRLLDVVGEGQSVPLVHGKPDAIVVHTLEARELALKFDPRARIVWFFHSGRIGFHNGGERPVEPELVQEIMVASYAMQKIWQPRYPKAKIWVVVPWYEVKPVWQWAPNRFFTMLNDPKSRWPERGNAIAKTMEIARERYGIAGWTLHGRGQPYGPLVGDQRDELMRSCTGYVDLVPPFGGFGLAHHEMFAAGVPVVSTPWGDLGDREGHVRMSKLGFDGFRYPLLATPEACAELVDLLNSDQDFAEYVSLVGRSCIRRNFTRDQMDHDIRQFLRGT